MELVKPLRGSRVFGSRGATVFELWKRDRCKKKKYILGDRMLARRGDERGDCRDDGGGRLVMMSKKIMTKTVMTSKTISETTSETITKETHGPNHDGTDPARAWPLLLFESEHQ